MFSSPNKSNAEANPGLDSFNSHRYSASPVRQDSADYLSSPRKTLRTVSKTPFRVLDAPDLTVSSFGAISTPWLTVFLGRLLFKSCGLVSG